SEPALTPHVRLPPPVAPSVAVYGVPAVAFGRFAVVICSGGCGAGIGGGEPPPAPPPPITVNTNCLSEWLSPPHQEGPPSAAVRSLTVTNRVVAAPAHGEPLT